MAPKELMSRYKVYKAKSKGLLYWLTKTAGACVELKTIVKSLTSLPLKASKKKAPLTTEHELRTAELIKLAEVIASSGQKIPEGITLIIQDIIAGREECAEWYSAQALEKGGKVDKENEGHVYFILVLRRVLDLFKAARAKVAATATTHEARPSTKTWKGKKSGKDEDLLISLFDCLELEEPSLNPLGAEPPPFTANTNAGAKQVSFRLEKEDEDAAFEVWCFLQDMSDVRKLVKQGWEEYSRGEISFLAASSVTDTAFSLLRCADDEFKRNGPIQSSDWTDIVHHTGLTFFCRGNAIWLCPKPNSTTKEPRIPNSQINVAELLCPIAFFCLRSYKDDAHEFCEMSHSEKYGKKLEKHVVRSTHHWHRICCVFQKLLPEIHGLGHSRSRNYAVIDEFVQGLADLHTTSDMPMWVTVCCQVYLDIYDLLGNNLHHGVQALQDTFASNRQLAADVAEYEKISRAGTDDVTTALDRLDWIASAALRFEEAFRIPARDEHDPLSAEQMRIKKEIGCAASALERSLPAHAGALLMNLKVGMHDVGCSMANHGFFVMSMAHLYRALRAMNAIKVDWQDMEFVIAAFGARQPLVPKGGKAYNGEAAARHYWLSLGISAQEFAVNGRQARGDSKRWVKRDPRKVAVTSPLLAALSERQNSWETFGLGSSKSKLVEAVLSVLATEEATNAAKSNAAGKPSSNMRETYTPFRLLETFKKRLLHDEPMLNFDFVTFTLDCARLLNDISAKVKPLVSSRDQPDICHLALVADLLCSPSSSKAIWETSGLVQSHFESHGKVNVKKAYDQSSGRIPKDLRPEIEANQDLLRNSRHLLNTVFDYSNAKASFSGPSMTAYHPGITPELCNGDSGKCLGHSGSETDPKSDLHGKHKIVSFGSALPKAIVEEGLMNVAKDPKAYIESNQRAEHFLYRRKHAHGEMTDEELAEATSEANPAFSLLNHIQNVGEPGGYGGEMYMIPLGHALYEKSMARLVNDRGDEAKALFAGKPLHVPVSVVDKWQAENGE